METTKYVLEEEEQKIQRIYFMDHEFSEKVEIDEPTFISSMVAHQLPPLDSVLESSEISLTMAAHVIIAECKNTLDTQQHISMIVHQIINRNTHIEQGIPKKIKDPSDAILMMNADENDFIPSMCSVHS